MFIVLNNTMYITMGITMFLSPLRILSLGYGSERGMMSRNEGGKGMLIHFVIILSSTYLV